MKEDDIQLKDFGDAGKNQSRTMAAKLNDPFGIRTEEQSFPDGTVITYNTRGGNPELTKIVPPAKLSSLQETYVAFARATPFLRTPEIRMLRMVPLGRENFIGAVSIAVASPSFPAGFPSPVNDPRSSVRYEYGVVDIFNRSELAFGTRIFDNDITQSASNELVTKFVQNQQFFSGGLNFYDNINCVVRYKLDLLGHRLYEMQAILEGAWLEYRAIDADEISFIRTVLSPSPTPGFDFTALAIPAVVNSDWYAESWTNSGSPVDYYRGHSQLTPYTTVEFQTANAAYLAPFITPLFPPISDSIITAVSTGDVDAQFKRLIVNSVFEIFAITGDFFGGYEVWVWPYYDTRVFDSVRPALVTDHSGQFFAQSGYARFDVNPKSKDAVLQGTLEEIYDDWFTFIEWVSHIGGLVLNGNIDPAYSEFYGYVIGVYFTDAGLFDTIDLARTAREARDLGNGDRVIAAVVEFNRAQDGFLP